MNSLPREQARQFYRPSLDVVRFLAFVAVFCHHSLPRTGEHSPVLITCANALGFGLSLFFVLSAYLITLLLLREASDTGSIQLPAFYKRRVLRIWPLYLLGIGIGIARAYYHGVLGKEKEWFIAALLLSGNLVYSGGLLMSHLWSISIEEQFYLSFPSTGRSFGRRGMFVFAVLLIVFANCSLVHFAHTHASLDTTVWFSTFVQFEMFAAGILLALADHHRPAWKVPGSALGVICSLSLWFVAAAACDLKTQNAHAQSAVLVCLGYAAVALACCLLILSVQGLPSPSSLVYSGRISYGLYVFHIPAITLITSHVSGVLGALLSLVATYGIAAFSYRFYEAPFLRLKRRFEFVPTGANTGSAVT